MNENFKKLDEVLFTNEEFQEKLKANVENYSGEDTPEAAFNNIMASLLAEYDISLSFDEFQSYMESKQDKKLDLDEMEQVAGGETDGVGAGASACGGLGLGLGFSAGRGGGWGFCIGVGLGSGLAACLAVGYTHD